MILERLHELLRSSARHRRLFQIFLVDLRKERFGTNSQDAIKRHPDVLRACRTHHVTPGTAIRYLDLACGEHSVHLNALVVCASIFSRNDTAFVERFEGRYGLRSAASVDTMFAQEDDGSIVLQSGEILSGKDRTYYVIEERKTATTTLNRGESFRAREFPSDRPVFIKMLSLRKPFDGREIDDRIARFWSFIAREKSSLMRLAEAGMKGIANFIHIGTVQFDIGSGRIKELPYLVQEYIPHARNLAEQFDSKELPSDAPSFRGIGDGATWIRIARELLVVLKGVHNYGVRHGDIQPDNVLWSASTGLSVVDFGQSSLVVPGPDPTGSVELRNPFAAPERKLDLDIQLEIPEDLYCAGATLFWLASGTYLPATRTTNYKLKEFVSANIRDELRSYSVGIVHVLCQCLHWDPRERASDAEEVLRTLDVFEALKGKRRDVVKAEDLHREIKTLREAVGSLRDSMLFSDMIRSELSYVIRRATEMVGAKRTELSGTRNELIAGLLAFMSTLGPGERYVTTSTARFWSQDNLGINGRFLAANEMLARRGVPIKRLFVLGKGESTGKAFQAVLAAQVKLILALPREFRAVDKELDSSGYYVGVLELPPKRRRAILRDGYHIGLIQKGKQSLSLSFRDDARGVIQKIYVWEVDSEESLVKTKIEEMEVGLRESEPILQLAARLGMIQE